MSIPVWQVQQQLIEELKKGPNTPEFMTGEGDEKYLFTRDFVLKVVRITHKYHLTIGHMLKKQYEDKRLAAIEADDDI